MENKDNLPVASEQTSLTTPSAAETFKSILELAQDPSFDVEKLKVVTDLQIKLLDRQKEEEFTKAKVAAILEMPRITKRGAIKNTQGKVQSRYSKFEDIERAVTPILSKHGLVFSHNVGHSGQMVTVQPVLSHVNGFVEKGGEMILATDTTGSKNATQGAGSASSYGKRHSIKAMLKIIEDGEDDDGQGGKKTHSLTVQEKTILGDGEMAALKGPGAYEAWYKGNSAQVRGWLIDTGNHSTFKEMASKT